MYAFFLFLHSWLRWLLLLFLVISTCLAWQGWLTKRIYNKLDRITASAATGLSHSQFLIGFTLYLAYSPYSTTYLKEGDTGDYQVWFFGFFHILMMIAAVGAMSVGSSLSKRAEIDQQKFKFVAISFSVALLLILAAVPWFRGLFKFW